MKRKDIFNILSWIFFIIGIVLLIWYIFGNSPTELAITITFLLMLMMKMWNIRDNLKDFKHEVRFSFHKIKEEINNMENRTIKLENKFAILSKTKLLKKK